MKGSWYIVAIAIIISTMAIYFNSYFFLIFYGLWLFYLYRSKRLGNIPILVSLTFLLFSLYYIPDVTNNPIHNIKINSKEQIEGKIVSTVLSTKKKVEFTLQETNTRNKLLIVHFPHSNLDTSKLKHGAVCTVTGQREKPKEPSSPGQFRYGDYLRKQGITNQFIVSSMEDIKCEGSSFFHRFHHIRSNLITKMEENLSPFTSAWLNALVLGDDSSLPEETVRVFQRWGLTHLVAISGTHIALLLGFFYFLVIKLSILTREKAQWMVVILLPIYAILAGGEPSVWRASVMVIMVILLHKLRFRFSALDVFSFAFIVLIFLNPYFVYQVGFQLSFLVTFGIILSRRWLGITNNSFYQALKISLVAQLIILPLQFNYFSLLQPLSILLNVIVIPYFSLIVLPLMYVLLPITLLPFSFFHIIDHFFIMIHSFILSLLTWLDSSVNFTWILGEFTPGMSVIYYIIFFSLMIKIQNDKKKLAFSYGIILVLFLFLLIVRPYFSPIGSVSMLDIGQGDAFVIELPYRKGVIMIDAGAKVSLEDGLASDKIYNHTIKPFLDSKGIQRIDALFLTHEDADHVGSVEYLLKDINVENIYISTFYEVSKEEEQLWSYKDIPVRRISDGEQVTIQDHSFFVLGPSKNAKTPNDNSIILFTEFGGLKWLFTGDIGKDIEKDLMNRYPNIRADVLKAAHHGSITSTDEDFLKQLNPSTVLISVGENNRYGHPADEVIQRIKASNDVRLLRTDKHGTVTFRFKYDTGTFFTYLP
ncbi:DNA internalization-related competence protein ComEC/Rec2 [Oceanobacillus senegalensis]|uniref:DNA internalization-related competence protein ComEC/Rec2 n=1 Tax=Oceanobacillus senegalensis TaxID=1936063 RepID=UPI000A306DE9|nr:DNA internalization-related competence protein ComEC/Rec2 [Oceanobacillus senegalensis]